MTGVTTEEELDGAHGDEAPDVVMPSLAVVAELLAR